MMAKPRKTLVVLALAALLAGHLSLVLNRRTRHESDFDVNRRFGARLLAGEPLYDDGLCFNYMPISALYWAPLAMVPPWLGITLRYVAAMACLGFVLHALTRMIRHEHGQFAEKRVAVIRLTILLALHYLLRDLDDGGPNLILLGVFVAGIDSAWKGREHLAGVWFGLGIALKMSPALLMPFFLWKRRWRLAGTTSVAAIAWIALPSVWMGPANWWQHQSQWNRMALTVFSGHDALRDGNELRVQNQTLPLAIKRFLVRYPQGHPLRLSAGRDAIALNLAPATADRIAKLTTLAVLGVCGWRSRKRYASPRNAAWLCETSTVLLLMLLLSPVTWLQHMVYAIPAIFLIATQASTPTGLPRGAHVCLAIYVMFSLVLNRALLGRDHYLMLLGFHIHTACMLILLVLMLWLRPTVCLRMMLPWKEDAGENRPSLSAALRRAG